MPEMLNSQVWPCFGCQIVPVSGTRSPIFQPKRVGEVLADDRALAIREPCLHLVRRQL